MTCIYDKQKGYEYHLNYCDHYFDLQRCSTWEYEAVRTDFCRNLASFLRSQLQVEYSLSATIAHSVFVRMSDSGLHYHTPLHPLSAFLFAHRQGMKLEAWEQLAIWFHDSIFMPDAKGGLNEAQSAAFMRAIIPYGHMMENRTINEAERAILFTGELLQKDTDPQFDQVIDLDLCFLAWPPKAFDKAAKLVRRECDPFMSLRAFCVSQKRFFEGLLDKGNYFRMPRMNQSHGAQARNNVRRYLSTLARTVE